MKQRPIIQESESELRRSIAQDPTAPAAYERLAILLQQQGRHKDVAEILERSLVALGESALTYCRMGIAYYQQALLPESIAAYEKAIALDSQYALAHYGLAFSLLMSGDFERG